MRFLKHSINLAKLIQVSGNLCLDNLEEIEHLHHLTTVCGIDCDHILDKINIRRGEANAKENRNRTNH